MRISWNVWPLALLLMIGCADRPAGVASGASGDSATADAGEADPEDGDTSDADRGDNQGEADDDPAGGTRPPQGQDEENSQTNDETNSEVDDVDDAQNDDDAAAPPPTIPPATVPAQVPLTPENTKIQFVGTHAGGEPNPRTGSFAEFSGELKVDPQTAAPVALNVAIQTASLSAMTDGRPNDRLTNHLKSPDFLDVRAHTTITFVSKSVMASDDAGAYDIVGDLTMHGVTQEVTISVTVGKRGRGMTVDSQFAVDRTQFGMDRMLDRVEAQVDLTVAVYEEG